MKNIVYTPFIAIFIIAVCAGIFGVFAYADATHDSYYSQNPIPAPTVVFVANPTTIKRGDSVALSWTPTNSDYCIASGGWTGWLLPGGAQNMRPTVTTEYSITCNGGGGSAASKVTVTVTDPTVTPPVVTSPTYTYYNPYTVAGYPVYPAYAMPTVSVSLYPSVINRGQAVTLSWTSSNANYCYAAGAWSGTKNLSGSEVLYPQVTGAYTITCTNAYGSQSDSKTVYVNAPVVAAGGFGIACSPSTGTSVQAGRSVAFSATEVGGAAPVTYRWSGDVSGVGSSITTSFDALGRKTAILSATDSIGRAATASCYVDVGAVQSASTAVKPKPPAQVVKKVDETECETICRAEGFVKPSEIDLAKDEAAKEEEDKDEADTKDRPSFLSFLAFGGGSMPPGLGLFLFMLFMIFVALGTVLVVFRLVRRKEV